MKKKLLSVTFFLTATFISSTNAEATYKGAVSNEKASSMVTEIEEPSSKENESVSELYNLFSEANSSMPSLEAFSKAMKGYGKLVEEGEIQNKILTVIDFSLPSSKKRMWVLDMNSNDVLFHTFVAHGRNTGSNMATKFSNTVNSFQSSLGFYVTGETYYGRNGLSLFIDGKEKGFNSRARERYVVVHGADYANPEFVTRNGRLGRSLGCPAVPTKVSKEIIETIKGKSAFFIYHTNKEYNEKSKYLKTPIA